MNEEKIFRNTWIGVGTKYGGQLIAAGVEAVDGGILSVANPSWFYQFGVNNVRLGPGLGAAIGAVAIVGFNIPSIMAMDGTEMSDWGLNLSLGGKWKEIGKALMKWKQYKTLTKVGMRAGMLRDIEELKLSVNYLWNAFDIGSRAGRPLISIIDLPAGTGLEVSLVITQGKFSILPPVEHTERSVDFYSEHSKGRF